MTTLDSEDRKRIVRRIPAEVANEGTLDAVDEIFAADVVDHTPLGDLRGRAAVREQFRQLRAAFPDARVTVEDVIAEDDTVATRVTWRGTHEGEYVGIEPTGREIEFSVHEFSRLADDKVVERWILPDQLGLMVQLGVVDPPMEPPDE